MNYDYFTKEQKIISFCTGYGGIELGLRGAGVDARAVCYVEIEAFAQANLVTKIEEGKMAEAPIWTDLKTFPSRMFSGKVDGIIGGYPCQPFSTAGKRKGEEDPRHLWPYIKRSIELIRPRWCFFENVEGHLTCGLKNVMHDLGELGYNTTAGLFSASEVGAPHRRKRLFILANSMCEGSQRSLLNRGDNKEGWDKQDGSTSASSSLWPMAQGEEQYSWEKPRSEIKSCLGSTINGFNAWVDQLRLLGNGVVPQTATLAFKTLSK